MLVLGVLFAAAAIFYEDSSGAWWLPSGRTLAFTLYTAIVFWGAVREFRRSWSTFGFWLSVCAILAVHVTVYSVAFSLTSEWRLVWLLPLSLAEFAVLLILLQRLGFD